MNAAQIESIVASVTGARARLNAREMLSGVNEAALLAELADNVAATDDMTSEAVEDTATDTALTAVAASANDVDGAKLGDVNARLATQETFNDQVITDMAAVTAFSADVVADLAELKTAIDAILAALKEAGLMTADA